MDDIKNSKPGQAYKILKRLGARPGENPEDGSFELPQHVKDGLSATQSADRLADVFAAISQEFPPLEISKLPEQVQNKIKQANKADVPYISRQMVMEKIKQANNTKGGLAGDLPVKLAKEF